MLFQMQLRVSDLLNDLHERTDVVEERIEKIENKLSNVQKTIDLLPERIGKGYRKYRFFQKRFFS